MTDYFIKLKNFYVAKYPVTTNLWNNVAEKSIKMGYDLSKRSSGGEKPVGNVSFYDVIKFCNAINELLGKKAVYYDENESVIRCGTPKSISFCENGICIPTVCEWEYAANGEKTTKFYWGDTNFKAEDNPYAWCCTAGCKIKTHNVGQKLPNDFGIYDILGNCFEWCFDEGNYGLGNIRGGSVSLDCVIDTKFSTAVPKDFTSFETGFRLFAHEETKIPAEFFNENQSCEKFINPKRNILDLIDTEHESMKDVKAYLARCDEKSAKECVVKEFINSIKNVDLDEFFKWNIRHKLHYLPILMDTKAPYKWYSDSNLDDILYSADSPKVLICEFQKTNDSKYVEKWFDIISDFCVKGKDVFDNLSDEQLSVGSWINYSWTYADGFTPLVRARAIISCLAQLAKEEKFDLIDVDKCLNIMISLITDHIYQGLKDPRELVPNQAVGGAISLIMYSLVFPFLKMTNAYKKIGFERYLHYLVGMSCLKDGGDLEQSFNYNAGIANSYLEVKRMYGGNFPNELSSVIELANERVYMLKAMAQPFGGMPGTGTTGAYYIPNLYADEAKLRAYKNEHLNSRFKYFDEFPKYESNFTSLCLPYSGYSVLRSGFGVYDTYLWTIGARSGMGHCAENINDIQLCAYGVNMLVSGGGSSYGNSTFVPEHQLKYIREIDSYTQESYGHNTVIIDGMGQSRYENGGGISIEPYDTPIDARFSTGDDVDFTEGFYRGNYGKGEKQITAMHNRQIMFIKPLNIFVIKDILEAKGEHEFTATYNIMPHNLTYNDDFGIEQSCHGYAPDDIEICDNKIRTTRKKAPNLAIYLPQNIAKIERHCGEFDPCYGWTCFGLISERFPKTDLHIKWTDTDRSERYTIITPLKDENEIIKSAQMQGGTLVITTTCGDVVKIDDNSIAFSENSKKTVKFSDFKVPSDFHWVKNGDKLSISYE